MQVNTQSTFTARDITQLQLCRLLQLEEFYVYIKAHKNLPFFTRRLDCWNCRHFVISQQIEHYFEKYAHVFYFIPDPLDVAVLSERRL